MSLAGGQETCRTLSRGSRVVVAMSGGVDSSVVAALLAGQGHEVIGVTLQLYDHGAATGRSRACCAGRDVADARAVAERLGIAHYVLDFEERFRRAVIDDFVDTYASGRTPTPCVRCNQRVKFDELLQIARDLGAEALATGHYARRVVGPSGPELHKARDVTRDQSYFLFTTTREQLHYVRFPLGDLAKRETRALAARLGLPVAAKPDSQDICFVPSGDYATLVRKLRPESARPGEILHVGGRVVGHHAGVVDYTVGQRRGLGVALGERTYVVALDAAKARVVVGPRSAGRCGEIVLEDLNWLPADGEECPTEVEVKHRYNEPPVPASLGRGPGRAARVRFAVPQSGVAPGQACVAYTGERCLGGGWIIGAPLLAATGDTRGQAPEQVPVGR